MPGVWTQQSQAGVWYNSLSLLMAGVWTQHSTAQAAPGPADTNRAASKYLTEDLTKHTTQLGQHKL